MAVCLVWRRWLTFWFRVLFSCRTPTCMVPPSWGAPHTSPHTPSSSFCVSIITYTLTFRKKKKILLPHQASPHGFFFGEISCLVSVRLICVSCFRDSTIITKGSSYPTINPWLIRLGLIGQYHRMTCQYVVDVSSDSLETLRGSPCEFTQSTYIWDGTFLWFTDMTWWREAVGFSSKQ